MLSKFIGVRDSKSVIVAGMSGAEQAAGGTLPMMWAGAKANTDDGVGKAAFRVYNNGHVDMGDVSISQSSSTGEILIDGGNISFNSNGGALTQILSKSMGSINNAINDAGGTVLTYSGMRGMVSCPVQNPAVEVANTVDDTPYTLTRETVVSSKTEAVVVKLFTAKYNGTFTLAHEVTTSNGLTAEPSNAQTQAYAWDEDDSGGRVQSGTRDFAYYGNVGKSYSLIGVYADEACTKSVASSSGKYSQTRGTTYYLKASIQVSAKLEARSNPYVYIPEKDKQIKVAYWRTYGSLTGTAKAIITASVVSTSTEYRSSYYSDGIYLQTKAQQYIGLTPASTPIMQMRSANAILKFTDKGLLQSLNGSTFYRANPIIYAVLFAWSGNKYTPSQWMNPLDLGKETERLSQGKIKVKHNFGKASYFPVAQALEGRYFLFAQVAAMDNNSVTIWRMDRNGTTYDGAFYLFLYDISTY